MGSNQSSQTSTGGSFQSEIVFMRIGGNAIAPITDQDLLSTFQQQQHPMRCFRVANGDWYKVVYNPAEQGLSTLATSDTLQQPFQYAAPLSCKVITAKHLFIGIEPPRLQRVLILPVVPADQSKSPVVDNEEEEEDRRSKLILPRIFDTSSPVRIHLDVGDVVRTGPNQELFVVVDVEPRGGGIVDSQTSEIYLRGNAVKRAVRARFAPAFGMASDVDRDRFRSFLRKVAGELLIRLHESVQDDYGKHWTVMEMSSSLASSSMATTRSDEVMILAHRAMVSIGWNPEVRPQTECLHCFRMVTSPFPEFDEFAFACPQCGFLVPNPVYPTWIQADRAASSSPAKQLLNRLRNALSDIHASDVRTLVIGSLIARLPKHLDGTLDWQALDEVAMRVLANPSPAPLSSTPEEVLRRLPVSNYVVTKPAAGGREEDELSASSSSTRDRCEICLEEYVDGVQVRTLPCFHRFHVTCSDNWLALATSCPLCKTEVDLTMPDEMLQ